MTGFFSFPEIFEPEDRLFLPKLKTSSISHAETPPPPSPGDAFVAAARTPEDLEPLARVLKKYPHLRDALYKALAEEGAFNSFA